MMICLVMEFYMMKSLMRSGTEQEKNDDDEHGKKEQVAKVTISSMKSGLLSL